VNGNYAQRKEPDGTRNRPENPEVMIGGTVPHYCVLCGLILPGVPELILHLDYEHTFWTQQYAERCAKAELANSSDKFFVAELVNVQGMA
jgi:hypothetical protein